MFTYDKIKIVAISVVSSRVCIHYFLMKNKSTSQSSWMARWMVHGSSNYSWKVVNPKKGQYLKLIRHNELQGVIFLEIPALIFSPFYLCRVRQRSERQWEVQGSPGGPNGHSGWETWGQGRPKDVAIVFHSRRARRTGWGGRRLRRGGRGFQQFQQDGGQALLGSSPVCPRHVRNGRWRTGWSRRDDSQGLQALRQHAGPGTNHHFWIFVVHYWDTSHKENISLYDTGCENDLLPYGGSMGRWQCESRRKGYTTEFNTSIAEISIFFQLTVASYRIKNFS